MTFRVLVTVGTDHHPFDRIVKWADHWAGDHPEAEVVVQFGHASAPHRATGRKLLETDELDVLMQDCDVVVTHGGPATITRARAHGLLPVAIGRDPQLGEHVDDHQQRFVRFLSHRRLVVEVEDEAQLRAALDEALLDPSRFRLDEPVPADETPAGVLTTARIVASLVTEHRRTTAPTPPVPSEAVVRAVGAGKPAPRDVTVLYIGGQGRSGSTLIERAVAELPGTVGVGEVVHLWPRGLRDDELCGCGEHFHACPFWTKVGHLAFGGWDTLDAEAMVRLRYAVDRNRHVPLMAWPGLSARYDRARATYTDALVKLYRAIADVSGASVIVDSSKHASYALLLSAVPGIDLRLLHVVRDSPAVAYAWTKQVVRPETEGELMPTYGPLESALLWDTQNVLLEWLGRRHPHVTVRYEDFVDDPGRELARVGRLVADRTCPAEDGGWSFLEGHTLHLNSSHSVAGNPMRFQHGDVTVSLDDSWRSSMPARSRRLVALLTAPVRARHGYLRGTA